MKFSELEPGQAFRIQDPQHPKAHLRWVRSRLMPETALLVEKQGDGTYMTNALQRREWPEEVEVTPVELEVISAQQSRY